LKIIGRLKNVIKSVSYRLSKFTFGIILRVYFRPRVNGVEQIPEQGGVILAANHFSFVDPLLLGTFLPRRVWFVMAEDMYRKPVFYQFSKLMDVVPVTQGVGQTGPIRRCLKLLKEGKTIGIFPEGQRSRTGALLPAQKGVGFLACRGGMPVVPAALIGTREAFPVGKLIPRPFQVQIFVGRPIQFNRSDDPEEVAARVRQAIADILLQHGREDYVNGQSVEEGV
jgi:1-acyl-sn-glycerol-3-phosphate acyltransferase